MWLDANIHAGEITGRLYMTYLIERLIYENGKNPDVTRNAIEIRRDYPVLAKINVSGTKLVDGESVKNIGHLLGKWSYIRYWIEGQDRSTKTVEWILEPTGSGSIEVTVEAESHKGGYDKKTITLKK